MAELYNSDDFSDVSTIYPSDSDCPGPSLKRPETPKTPKPKTPKTTKTKTPKTKTPKTPKTKTPKTKTPNATNDDIGRFWINDVEFINAKDLAQPVNKSARRISPVWKFGTEAIRVQDRKRFWLCGVCKNEGNTTIISSSATTGAAKHLEKQHGYRKYKGRFVVAKSAKVPSSCRERPRDSSPSFLSQAVVEEFRFSLLQWLICCHIALSMVENPFFRHLIEFVGGLFIQFLPASANTIRKWVLDEHQRQKDAKKEILRKARSRISISFDTWTSPFSKKNVLSVIAHFVDENWERRHLQLSMLRLYGGHSGENIAHHVVPVLQQWGIASRLGYFVTDNEPANGTAIDHILEAIEPERYRDLPKTIKRAELRKRWVRCLAHSVNLICQAFILGRNPEVFVKETVGAELFDDLDRLNDVWRTRGFVGKLANIVRYIRRSPKQRAEFERIRFTDSKDDVYWVAVEEVEDDEQLELVANNKTRWNSTYDMLSRAHKLKMRLQAYCENWKPTANKTDDDDADTNYDLSKDKLTAEEWEGVEEVLRVLRPLKKLTKELERRETGLQDFAPYCDMILRHLHKCAQQFKEKARENDGGAYEWLWHCTEAAWDKANEVYKKADDSPAYYTARVVTPEYKFAWFEERWGAHAEKKKWIKGLKSVVNHCWKQYPKRDIPDDSNSIFQQGPTPQSSRRSRAACATAANTIDDEFDPDLYLAMPITSKPSRAVDEFAEFTSSPVEQHFELAEWQRIESKHPDLVQFALDHAAIPISVSECERSFSSAKFALNPLRTRMKSDLFEALETLRAWYLDDERRRQNTESQEDEERHIAEVVGEADK